MRKIILITFLILGFLAFTEKIFGQEFYKWVDEKGTVHFSDTPPSSTRNQEKELPKENGIEVLKKLETASSLKGYFFGKEHKHWLYTKLSGSSG
jgi:hypothetical protein